MWSIIDADNGDAVEDVAKDDAADADEEEEDNAADGIAGSFALLSFVAAIASSTTSDGEPDNPLLSPPLTLSPATALPSLRCWRIVISCSWRKDIGARC